MAFVTHLKEIRTKQHINQTDLAIAIGTCPKSISNIECGKNCPSVEMALRMAAYLNTTVEMLFSIDDD